jgi:hypothetical protein
VKGVMNMKYALNRRGSIRIVRIKSMRPAIWTGTIRRGKEE